MIQLFPNFPTLCFTFSVGKKILGDLNASAVSADQWGGSNTESDIL